MLTVTPVLRDVNGGETPLTPVAVQPQEVKTLDIETTIGNSAPQLIGTYGSLVLRYQAASTTNLYAVAMVMGVGHSLAFHIDGTGEDQSEDIGSREGIWWLPNQSATDFLVLINQGQNPLQASLSVFDASGAKFTRAITLAPRGAARYSVRQIVSSANLAGSFGGISVSALSHAGSLDTLHIVFDAGGGFSAVMKMFDHDPRVQTKERDYASTGKWTLRAPMLALANPDPSLAFPPGTVLRPQLFLRSVTSKPVEATLAFGWRTATATGKATGPTLLLSPHETRRIDVASLQDGKTLPQTAQWTSVALTTNSLPGEVVAVAASYDQTLKYGAQTPFSDQLAFHFAGSQWQYDPDHDSIIAVGNGGTKPTRAAFTIFYNQGTQKYEIEQTLQPDEQMWMDVGKLIREHIRDKNGNSLPEGLTSGSYEIRDLMNKGIGTLFEGKVIYDKTYGHVTYGCIVCCGYASSLVWFDPLGIPLLGTSNDGVTSSDTCSGRSEDTSGSFFGNWTTANSSIATVDYWGTHTGQSIGSTTSSTFGFLQNAFVRQNCPVERVSPGGNANVNPPTATISIQFTGNKSGGDNLTFPSSSTCSQALGPHTCPSTSVPVWDWSFEVSASVTDDASKWTVTQTIDSGRAKGNWKDSNGALHAFDTTIGAGSDGPDSSFLQQTGGQKTIFYIDSPNEPMNLLPGESVDSATKAVNFTAHFCSTVVTSACYTQPFFVKLVINPGGFLSLSASSAALGTTSTNF